MRSLFRPLLAALAALSLAVPAGAVAAPETVLQDDALLLHGGDDGVPAAMGRLKHLGVDRVRLTAGWSVIAPSPDSPTPPDFDATDPAAYPNGAWHNLDRAVREAHAHGLKVMIDIAFWAPRWATGDQPTEPNRLRTNIDPAAYARFAQAVARRYAGDYRPPATGPGEPRPAAPDDDVFSRVFGVRRQDAPADAPPAAEPLPAVDVFTIWNEPNHPGFVMPQWTRRDGGWWPAAADIYRAMVRAAYPVIKEAAPQSTVLIGATASGGASEPGVSGVPPLHFLRALACVDDDWKPVTTGDCAGYTTLPGDGWSHHPYSLRTLPEAEPQDADKLPVASTPRLLAALRRLVDAGRLAPRNRELWQTEYGYETSPPDPRARFGPELQADLLARAERLGTSSAAVKSWPQFLLRDRPGDPAGPQMRAFGDWQTGLERADGTPKPAFAEFRTPSVASCRRTSRSLRLSVWGRWRGVAGAKVRLQRKLDGRWVDTGRTVSVPRASAAVTLVAAWRAGAPARLQWSAEGRSATTRELAPRPCSQPRGKAAARDTEKRGVRRRANPTTSTARGGGRSRQSARGHDQQRSR